MLSRTRPSSGPSPESLESRLRALPQPPVPSDLEARILAGNPAKASNDDEIPRVTRNTSRRWRLGVRAVASVAAAAACLLAVRFWPEPNDRRIAAVLAANPQSTKPVQQATPKTQSDSLWTTPWLKGGHDLDETEMPTFTWPIQEKSPLVLSTALRPDLFD
jgi:hypothetical protein